MLAIGVVIVQPVFQAGCRLFVGHFSALCHSHRVDLTDSTALVEVFVQSFVGVAWTKLQSMEVPWGT